MATQFTDRFGFLNIDISNGNPHTKLTATFYENRGSEMTEELQLKKKRKIKIVKLQLNSQNK